MTDSEQCDCVSTFGRCERNQAKHDTDYRGNFYSYPGSDDSAGILNLDALPEKMPLVECGLACLCEEGCSSRVTQRGLK